MRTIVGGGGARWYLSWEPEAPKPNFAEILIHTTDGRLTHEFAEELRRVIAHGDVQLGLQPIVGARVVPIELFLGPPADPVVLRVIGSGYADMTKLRTTANRVKKMVDSVPETISVSDSWGVDSQQLFVDVESDRANLARVRNAEIASTLDTYFSGRLLTYFREGEHQIPVYFHKVAQTSCASSDARFASSLTAVLSPHFLRPALTAAILQNFLPCGMIRIGESDPATSDSQSSNRGPSTCSHWQANTISRVVNYQ